MSTTSLAGMVLCVLLCALATWLTRILPLYCLARDMPRFVKDWLDFVPAAVMAALVAPDVLFYGGDLNPDPTTNLFLVAALAAIAFAMFVKNFFATIVFAMAFVAAARYFGILA